MRHARPQRGGRGSDRYPYPASDAVRRSMLGNRRTGTAPEARVRSAVHRAGLRFRKDYSIRLEAGHTRADLAFPRLQLAVFIDGCFWHGCPRHGTAPRHNAWYWTSKLRGNRMRDQRATEGLRRRGWVVRRYWEHMPSAEIAERVVALVRRLRG